MSKGERSVVKEYFLKFWGGACPTIEAELGIKERNFWFATEEERENLVKKLLPYSHLGLALDREEGEMTHKRTVASVTLRYKGKEYSYKDDFGYEYPEEAARFSYEENNYSCDCNRSLFISRECDPDFSEMDCGDEIELVSLKFEYLD